MRSIGPAVTREQSPAFLRNSTGRLDLVNGMWPMQIPEIMNKGIKSSSKNHIKYHWKTIKRIICQGSYEIAVVDYLRKVKIDFRWQEKIFTTSFKTKNNNFKTYR